MKLRKSSFYAMAFTGALAAYHPAVLAQGDPFFAVLVGGTEVNAAGQANKGDLDGFGTATVIVHRTTSTTSATLCFGITVRGIDRPTAAHIHLGRAGINGGVVVPLTPPLTGNPGASSGCVPNVPIAVANGLIVAPANYYVNVHTLAFPNGALRGNLF